MASETTTLDVAKPDQVHLDSAFADVAPGQNNSLFGFDMALLGGKLAIDFGGLDVTEDPGFRLRQPFADAVAALDTRMQPEATFDAAPENFTAERQPEVLAL